MSPASRPAKAARKAKAAPAPPPAPGAPELPPPPPQAGPAKRVVLVTGTSSGIGRESVGHLRAAGCLVVATARDPAAIADLAVPGEVECLRLDVVDDASRRACVAEVLRRHGRIDALVNNAGYGAMLAVEDTDLVALQAMYATNVYAPHELARLVLPHMRAQGSGRIVNVSSIAGHVAVPLMGGYCSTKHALRALTQAMDSEVREHGVRAVLVEPGVIQTNFGTHSLKQTKANVRMEESVYVRLYRKWGGRREKRHGAHPRVIAKRIVRACTARRPRNHYFAPMDAKATNLLKRLLPDAVVLWALRRYFK